MNDGFVRDQVYTLFSDKPEWASHEKHPIPSHYIYWLASGKRLQTTMENHHFSWENSL